MSLLEILNTFNQVCLEQPDVAYICKLEELPFTKVSSNLVGDYRLVSANASLPQRVEHTEEE